jgi:hypothetical protein
MLFIRPLFGLLQGLIIYLVINHTHFSNAGMMGLITLLTFPLVALQIKLPNKKTIFIGLAILISMAIIYSYSVYHLYGIIENSSDKIAAILLAQCILSAFILFIFYCVVIEEERFHFPYSSLFCEAWKVILKIPLAKLLVFLTWSLCFLAGVLSNLLNITLVNDIVSSQKFTQIMIPFFFGIAMTILAQQEDILTKLRNILLAFCQFLFPIFVIISLSFLLIIPFSNKNFADFWQSIIVISVVNILLFNGIFQAGLNKPPYSRWFSLLIYTSLIITTI